MNNAKITVPPSVATAIRFFTDLADTKHEAFADIMRLGYETERSETILRHFDGNYDLLMEALICGYQIEKSPEEKVRDYYSEVVEKQRLHREYDLSGGERHMYSKLAIKKTLNLLGVTIAGINGGDE